MPLLTTAMLTTALLTVLLARLLWPYPPLTQASCSTCTPPARATRTCPTSSSTRTSTRSGSASSASTPRHPPRHLPAAPRYLPATPRHPPRHATPPTRNATYATYACQGHIRLQPPPPTVAAPATYGCRYAGYSPEEWLAEVSGVPFGLPVSPHNSPYLPISPYISLHLRCRASPSVCPARSWAPTPTRRRACSSA